MSVLTVGVPAFRRHWSWKAACQLLCLWEQIYQWNTRKCQIIINYCEINDSRYYIPQVCQVPAVGIPGVWEPAGCVCSLMHARASGFSLAVRPDERRCWIWSVRVTWWRVEVGIVPGSDLNSFQPPERSGESSETPQSGWESWTHVESSRPGHPSAGHRLLWWMKGVLDWATEGERCRF